MADNGFERVPDDHPNRCQGIVATGHNAGQCWYKAVPNSTFCPRCGGAPQINKNEAMALKNYRLKQYAERVGSLANNPEIKNLREEIGITRMVLETLLNKVQNENELLIYIDKITGLVDSIKKLIEAAQKMEEKNNNLLDRQVVIVIGDSIVSLLSNYITDPDQLNEIGGKICESITRAASSTNSERLVT